MDKGHSISHSLSTSKTITVEKPRTGAIFIPFWQLCGKIFPPFHVDLHHPTEEPSGSKPSLIFLSPATFFPSPIFWMTPSGFGLGSRSSWASCWASRTSAASCGGFPKPWAPRRRLRPLRRAQRRPLRRSRARARR